MRSSGWGVLAPHSAALSPVQHALTEGTESDFHRAWPHACNNGGEHEPQHAKPEQDNQHAPRMVQTIQLTHFSICMVRSI